MSSKSHKQDARATGRATTEYTLSWPPGWYGQHIEITELNADFDFANTVSAEMERQEDSWLADDLFSLSPLTTPESTPPASPSTYSHDLPEDPAQDELPYLPREIYECKEGLRAPPPTPTNQPHQLPTLPVLQTVKGGPIFGPAQPIDRKRRKAKRANLARKNKRLRLKEENYGLTPPRDEVYEKYLGAAQPLPNELKAADIRVTKTGYTALNKKIDEDGPIKLEDLVGPASKWKFKLQKWDGKTPIPIIDHEGCIIALLAGRPADDNWDQVQEAAAVLLEKIRAQSPEVGKACHRRGDFPTLRCGVSHRGGQTRPMNHANSPTKQRALDELNSHPSFIRIAGFMNSALATWAPKLHEHYAENITSLFSNDNTLHRPFPNSIFPATTYNLGPQTVCNRHFDFTNLAYGWCGIAALGKFDPTKGGHLILWELGLVVEFPPGSVVLIPSAVISHSNTPIAPNEARYSITQYAAGAIFRWVDSGFQKASTYQKSLKGKEKADLAGKDAERWKTGVGLYPCLPYVSQM